MLNSMEIEQQLPPVRRLRDYYVYTEDGRRLLDLSLDSGGGFCGHRPSGFAAGLKRVLSRGGTAAVPSREAIHAGNWLRRFREAFLTEYADYRAELMPPAMATQQLPSLAGLRNDRLLDCWAPAFNSASAAAGDAAERALVIRPGYAPEDLQERLGMRLAVLSGTARPAALLPVLPVPRSLCPQLVLVRPDRWVPAAVSLSADSARGTTSELGAYCISFGLQLFLTPRYPSFSGKRQDIHWFPGSLADAGWQKWNAVGPYQYFTGCPAEYREIRAAALARDILLPDDPGEPAIMPAAISARDMRTIRELAACKPIGISTY